MLLWDAVDRKHCPMPHLKCDACRARVRRTAARTSPVELCPLCGGPLQAVTDLTEIVGFRVVDAPGSPTSEASAAGYQRLARSVGEIVAARRAIDSRTRLDIERWSP
jgi:hypothetical protein